jgi:hypothetical protein
MRIKPNQQSRPVWPLWFLAIACLCGACLHAQPGPSDGGGGGGTNGVPEAPIGTGQLYARTEATWQAFPPGLWTLQTDAPTGGGYYARRDEAWALVESTVSGGSLDIAVAAAAEFQPANTNGTLVPVNTWTNINFNHFYDPSGLIQSYDSAKRTWRMGTGRYALTVAVPISVAGAAGGNSKVPYSIALWDYTRSNAVYYSTYVIYDDDESQYTSVFMPVLESDGVTDFGLRVANLSTVMPIKCGTSNDKGVTNHYSEIQILKLSAAITLPSTEWAATNLLVNPALETGQLGQALGYIAPGTIGVVSLGAAGGADTNAVASVPDLATLTNSVIGYSKAIVGLPGETTHKLFQRVTLSVNWIPLPTGSWLPFDGSQSLSYPGDGSVTCTGTGGANVYVGIVLANDTAVVGKRYLLRFDGKSNEPANMSTFGYWSDYAYSPSHGLTTEFITYTMLFTATNPDALFAGRADATESGDSITVRNAFYADTINIGNSFPSAAEPGYAWEQVYLEWQGGGGANVVKTISIPDASAYAQTLPSDADTLVLSIPGFANGLVYLTGTPVIAPGSFVGQVITILHVEGPESDDQKLVFEDYRTTATSGLELLTTPIIAVRHEAPKTISLIWDGEKWVQTSGSLAVPTTEEVTLLPAPWPPPDANGVQTLSPEVKDALVVELVPWFLTNSARLFPSGLVSTNATTP